jgi:hypothetical protein
MTISSTSLQGLGHEQLVSLVRGTVGSARPTATRATTGRVDSGLYRRDPRVPAARIETYPRRRRARAAAVSLAAPVAASVSAVAAVDEPTYADFLVAAPAHAMSA